MNVQPTTGKPQGKWGTANAERTKKEKEINVLTDIASKALTVPEVADSSVSAPKGKWGAANAKRASAERAAAGPAIKGAADLTAHLPTTTFQGQISVSGVSQLSRRVLEEAAQKDGALSIATHNKQMEGIEQILDDWVAKTKASSDKINQVINEFFERVKEANKEIAEIYKEVVKRYKEKDKTLDPDDIEKAKNINQFIADSVKLMEVTCDSAIVMTEKGTSVISEQTKKNVLGILEIRTAQVALFAAKLKVFQEQEKHELNIILQVQEAKLKEQQQLFAQLEAVARLLAAEKNDDAKRELEKDKAILEAEIALRAQFLKEEESHNRQQLEAFVVNAEIDNSKKRVEIESAAQQAKAANETLKTQLKAQVRTHEANIKAQTEQAQISASERVNTLKVKEEAEAQKQAIAANERTQHFQTFASIVKPPCVVM